MIRKGLLSTTFVFLSLATAVMNAAVSEVELRARSRNPAVSLSISSSSRSFHIMHVPHVPFLNIIQFYTSDRNVY